MTILRPASPAWSSPCSSPSDSTLGASLYRKIGAVGIVREWVRYTALLVGAVGSGYTAEIGSMNVTEQVDAIRALGADPIRKLVMPRVFAITLALPLLTMLADLVGCAGGAIITMHEVNVTWRFVYEQMRESIWIVDLLHGLEGVFRLFDCHHRMLEWAAQLAVEGVGLATTKTVVYISVSIFISDFALTRLFLAIYG